MKTIKVLSLFAFIIFAASCGNKTKEQAHTHEGEATHTHAADDAHVHESDATHTHEGDTTHYHDASDTTHIHESDATHTHEGDTTHTHAADDAHVHESDTTHTHDAGDAVDQQHSEATVVDHKTLTLKRQSFHFVKRTSGQLLPDNKDVVIITAKSSGIVRFNDHFIYPGIKVAKGESLFTIGGENLTENNAELNFAKVKADYSKAKANFDRASGLIADKLITQDHFLELKNEYEKAEAEYTVYKSVSGKNVSVVRSPESCFLNEIYITEGEMVQPGDKLASIFIERKMVLRADISPEDFDIIDQIEAAKFACGYSDIVYSTEKMNGSKISYGRSTGGNSFYIPLYFRIDYNKELIPGTFTDIWLIGKEKPNAIVIPNNAIMEEFGKFYVYIDHVDHFDKRFITLGQTDGESTLILSGLAESESIVTEGVYQVKMSMMTSIPNTHDHSH